MLLSMAAFPLAFLVAKVMFSDEKEITLDKFFAELLPSKEISEVIIYNKKNAVARTRSGKSFSFDIGSVEVFEGMCEELQDSLGLSLLLSLSLSLSLLLFSISHSISFSLSISLSLSHAFSLSPLPYFSLSSSLLHHLRFP